MATYLVRWEIDAEDVDTPYEAALQAWEAMHRENTTATFFTVTDDKGASFKVDIYDAVYTESTTPTSSENR